MTEIGRKLVMKERGKREEKRKGKILRSKNIHICYEIKLLISRRVLFNQK